MGRIVSYRGLLANGGKNTIPLHTNDGKTGYKVVKFRIINSIPGGAGAENVMKIFKTDQVTVDSSVDFSDNTLLGVATWGQNADHGAWTNSTIFDNEIFNQDIYVTHKDEQGGSANYYIELEQMDITEDQALVAIVKNLRNEQ
jgi:hypothetical protein